MFALLSERPEYASSIKNFIAWAPAVFMSEMRSNLTFALRMLPFFHKLGGKFTPTDHLASWIGGTACKSSARTKSMVTKEWAKANGPTDQMNLDRMAVYFHFWPSPSSVWQLVHFGQLYQSGKFQKFDYGSAQLNVAHYGVESPPEYPLTSIPEDMNIIIMNGATDYLVTPENVEHLVEILRPRLPNLQHIPIESEMFNHTDFIFGKDAGTLVYDKTIELLDRLS